jgi:hypothetical protein
MEVNFFYKNKILLLLFWSDFYFEVVILFLFCFAFAVLVRGVGEFLISQHLLSYIYNMVKCYSFAKDIKQYG